MDIIYTLCNKKNKLYASITNVPIYKVDPFYGVSDDEVIRFGIKKKIFLPCFLKTPVVHFRYVDAIDSFMLKIHDESFIEKYNNMEKYIISVIRSNETFRSFSIEHKHEDLSCDNFICAKETENTLVIEKNKKSSDIGIGKFKITFVATIDKENNKIKLIVNILKCNLTYE